MLALLGLLLALLLALGVAHRELLRHAFLAAEDPRALAAVRIGFTACAIVGVLEPLSAAHWLFADDGMFLRAGTRALAGDAFAGWTDDRFHDLPAAWHYLSGGHATPLHFWASPALVTAWSATLLLAMLGLLLGWHTRVCAWLAFLLYLALLRSNAAWAGGEQVYVAGLFCLATARCGHAWSIDNWRRCRDLRRRGLLSLPGGPGDGAGTPTLAAIYRRIPAWPRLLLIAQVTVAYGLNGLNKSGTAWWDGTALFYILQGDWARFDVRPLLLLLGTDVVAAMTWFVRAWETLFPLVTLGLVVRFSARENLPPPRGARWLWLALGLVATALAGQLVAHHPRFAADDPLALTRRWWLFGGLLTLALFAVYPRLQRGLRLGRHTIDRVSLARWLLGRRVWLTGAVLFTVPLVLTLNVGVFPLATLAMTLAMFRGESYAALAARLRRRPAVACEDPTLPHLHHDDAAIPPHVLVVALALPFAGVVALDLGAPPWLWRWSVCLAAILLLATRRPGPVHQDMSRRPWAYGPLGRLLIGALCVAHLTALACASVPIWKDLRELADTVKRPVQWWPRFTGVYQFWAMFSGTPRHNSSLRTAVIDADGRLHDLHSEQPRDGLALWNHRQSKIDANILQKKPHTQWHARAVCRRFARAHDRLPQQVLLHKVDAPILPPTQPAEPSRAARFAAHAVTSPIDTIDCRSEPHAQPPDHPAFVPLPAKPSTWPQLRARHGPLWPYDEWLFVLVALALALRRRHG